MWLFSIIMIMDFTVFIEWYYHQFEYMMMKFLGDLIQLCFSEKIEFFIILIRNELMVALLFCIISGISLVLHCNSVNFFVLNLIGFPLELKRLQVF